MAQVAIKAMDGCQVGNKKLKVEHKKLKQQPSPQQSSPLKSLSFGRKEDLRLSGAEEVEGSHGNAASFSADSFYAQHKLISSNPADYSLLPRLPSTNSTAAPGSVGSFWN